MATTAKKKTRTLTIDVPEELGCTLRGTADMIRVGDFVRQTKEHGAFRLVRGVYRLERGIQILVADGPDGECVIDLPESGEIDFVSRRRDPCFGFTLYRVDHPVRSGVIAWVTIPADEE